MADIKPADFANQCLTMALRHGINAHYLAAVGMLRSKLKDDTVDSKVGPYRWTQTEWDNNPDRTNIAFGEPFESSDLTDWRAQVSVFSLMALREFNSLQGTLGRNPSALELYQKQFPAGATDAQLAANLKKACDDTAQPIRDAINQQLPADPTVAAPLIAAPNNPVATQPPVA